MWLVNTTDQEIDVIVHDLKRIVKFRPRRPVELDISPATSINMCGSNFGLKACPDSDRYFIEHVARHLIIRDAGIGDLLLMEPLIRALNEAKREMLIASRYPQVYAGHPAVVQTFEQSAKSDMKFMAAMNFDMMTDMRSVSETHPERDKITRTDIYFKKFPGIDTADKEPRIYFTDEEKKPFLEKKEGKIYVGISCEASHIARRYSCITDLCKTLLAKKNIVPVLIGNADAMECIDGCLDYRGSTSIRDMFRLVRDCDAVIAVDSGVMHVALSLHVPTVCYFTIISPEFRLTYYTGPKVVIEGAECCGCGDFHMDQCGKCKTRDEIPPCTMVDPVQILQQLLTLPKVDTRRFFDAGKVTENVTSAPVPVKRSCRAKITMPIIVLNEEKNLPRFIELVMSHPAIGRVVAIDGGSTDKTVELLTKAGAFVYTHYYDKTYHDMQAMQRNYSLSFVPDGEKVLIMDIDECFSKELSDYLYEFADSRIEYGLLSRRTFRYYSEIDDKTKRIKNYPDYQPRLYTWNRRFKFVGSPHHLTLNCPLPAKIQKDIIHFECEGKDRDALEKTWATMHKATKEIYK